MSLLFNWLKSQPKELRYYFAFAALTGLAICVCDYVLWFDITAADKIGTLVLWWTALVIAWYAFETQLLRSESQNRHIQIKPFVTISVNEDSIKVENLGQGIAINARLVIKAGGKNKTIILDEYIGDIGTSPLMLPVYKLGQGHDIYAITEASMSCIDISGSPHHFVYVPDEEGALTAAFDEKVLFRLAEVSLPVLFKRESDTYTIYFRGVRTNLVLGSRDAALDKKGMRSKSRP